MQTFQDAAAAGCAARTFFEQPFQVSLEVGERGDLLIDACNMAFDHGVDPATIRSGIVLEGKKFADFRELHAVVAAVANEVQPFDILLTIHTVVTLRAFGFSQ